MILANCAPLQDLRNGSVEFSKSPYTDGHYPENTRATFSCERTFLRHGPQRCVVGIQTIGVSNSLQYATKWVKTSSTKQEKQIWLYTSQTYTSQTFITKQSPFYPSII